MTEISLKTQYLGTFLANLVVLGYGASTGWTSPTIPILQSSDTPLTSGPLNDEQISWIGSLLCVGGLTGTFLFGWICDKYGRKFSVSCMAIPQLASWILILIGTDASYLYVSRFVAGLAGGGVFLSVPLYISEIAETRVRGALGSIVVFAANFGLLFMYVTGNYLSYYWNPLIFSVFPIASFIGLSFLPETPFYLAKMKRFKHAEDSLKYYRGIKSETPFDTINDEINALVGCTDEKLEKLDSVTKSGIKLSDFASRHVKRALLIGITIVIYNQFSGCFAMLNYTATIFEKAGSAMSPNNSAIIVGLIQIIGNYCATMTVERLGRKLCMVFSAIGIAFGFATMGTYTLLDTLNYDLEMLKWIPLASFSFIIFIASLGVCTIPFIMLSEIMPQEIKAFTTTMCIAVLWSCAFIVIKILPSLISVLEMYGAMYLFAFVSVIGTILVLVLQPETKGKSFDEIKRMLEK